MGSKNRSDDYSESISFDEITNKNISVVTFEWPAPTELNPSRVSAGMTDKEQKLWIEIKSILVSILLLLQDAKKSILQKKEVCL